MHATVLQFVLHLLQFVLLSLQQALYSPPALF